MIPPKEQELTWQIAETGAVYQPGIALPLVSPHTIQTFMAAIPLQFAVALGLRDATQIQVEIEYLKSRVSALEQEMAVLKTSIPEDEIILLRTVSREQAKEEIKTLFDQGGTWYYSDIARYLRLELAQVVELCLELEKSGEIEIDADAV